MRETVIKFCKVPAVPTSYVYQKGRNLKNGIPQISSNICVEGQEHDEIRRELRVMDLTATTRAENASRPITKESDTSSLKRKVEYAPPTRCKDQLDTLQLEHV
jgi:hypothetical protein